MNVHVKFETPEAVATKIYELVQACNSSKIKKGANEVTKAALRKNAQIVILAEDVNPPELVHHIPLICDDAGIPYAYVPSQEFLAKEANLPGGVKAATIALMDINKGAKELFDEVVELVGNLKA